MGILDGFVFLFSQPTALFFVALAAFVGVIVGALPGLTPAAAIAMLLPITFYLDPLSALVFLYVIGKSGRFGGSISAILFNTPGTTASAATMIDGYPLAQQGKSGKALKVAAVASVFGDTTGELILIFGAAAISVYTSRFGPPENFSIYLMAFVVIGSVMGRSITKGLLSTIFGALISLVGLDPMTGAPRLTMGLLELENGFSLIPLLIGVFVMSEVLIRVESIDSDHETQRGLSKGSDPDANRMTWSDFRRCLPTMFRSAGVGSFIGMLPGLGSSIACFVAYGEERRRARNPDEWGKGAVEGVAAPESANNAVSGPSMIPLLTLGIPGSTIAAILIGVFTIHGIQIGPQIFETAHDLIFGLFAAGLVGIALYGLIGFFGGPIVGRLIMYMPERIIYPFIFITAFVASYSARSSVFDVAVMIAFGFIGYIMRRYEFSPAAFIIAFVLGQSAEEAFRQSLVLTDNGIWIFLERPVALSFMGVGFAVMLFRAVQKRRSKDKTLSADAQ